MKDLNKLEQALERRFPGEKLSSLAKLLSTASEKGKITFEGIEAEKGAKEDHLLFLYGERLLIPTRTSQVSRSLAWEDRLLITKPRETYEMRNAIRYLIRNAEETGEWKPNYAVRRYLEDIGEIEVEKIVRLFQEVREKVVSSEILSKTKRITPELLKECSERLGLELNIDKTIAELKGGGIMSPCLRNFSSYGIRYEMNPSLL
jgi:hypothetical protein